MTRDWIDDFEQLADDLADGEAFDGDVDDAFYYSSEQIRAVLDKWRSATGRDSYDPCSRVVGWATCHRPAIGVDSEGPYCERHKA